MPTGYAKDTGLNPFKGKKRRAFTPEHRAKIGAAGAGRVPWNKGKKGLQKMSLETRKKMSESHPHGSKHPMWKGSKVGYDALHRWVVRHFGRARDHTCGHCGCTNETSRLQWANMDHKYTRDIETWKVLCALCHNRYDRYVMGSYNKIHKHG